jgi:hypothetical protein
VCECVCVSVRVCVFVSVCVSVCVYSLSYPACKAHAPYCIVTFDPSGSTTFCTSSHKTPRFSKKNTIEHKMYVLIPSTTSARNISHSKYNSARYYHKCA